MEYIFQKELKRRLTPYQYAIYQTVRAYDRDRDLAAYEILVPKITPAVLATASPKEMAYLVSMLRLDKRAAPVDMMSFAGRKRQLANMNRHESRIESFLGLRLCSEIVKQENKILASWIYYEWINGTHIKNVGIKIQHSELFMRKIIIESIAQSRPEILEHLIYKYFYTTFISVISSGVIERIFEELPQLYLMISHKAGANGTLVERDFTIVKRLLKVLFIKFNSPDIHRPCLAVYHLVVKSKYTTGVQLLQWIENQLLFRSMMFSPEKWNNYKQKIIGTAGTQVVKDYLSSSAPR